MLILLQLPYTASTELNKTSPNRPTLDCDRALLVSSTQFLSPVSSGACIRLDTTLVDFTEMHWERGDITFLYCGDAKASGMSLFVMDNDLKVLRNGSFHQLQSEPKKDRLNK